jgi:hypothetical protein
MNKASILKAFGGSEEDFYKLYPTEEHFKMAFGGTPQFAQNGATTKPVFDVSKYANAKKVLAPSPGYKEIPGQDPQADKRYYDIQAEKAKVTLVPGSKEEPKGDPKKLLEYWKDQVKTKGVNPKSVIEGKHLDPSFLTELEEVYNPQYTEKTKTIPPPPKKIDLGIGWAGHRDEKFGNYLPPFKDSSGKEYRIQQFEIPAKWDSKTKSWDTSGGKNQGTVLSGYYDEVTNKFTHLDTSASKFKSEGEGAKTKNWYTQEGLVQPEYAQQEAEKVMKHGPLIISGNTAIDVQNTGMNYNPEKDVVAPINTMGSGKGIGQDKLIKEVGIENLPAGTGYLNTGQTLPLNKQGGPLFNPYIPDFFNPQYLMKKGGVPCMNCGGYMQDGSEYVQRCDQEDGWTGLSWSDSR